VLVLYPALMWVAPIASGLFLFVQWREGGAGPTKTTIGLAWFVLALYLQFFTHSPVLAAMGLVLQTLLAVTLVAIWNAA
jgi:hypothetical protein